MSTELITIIVLCRNRSNFAKLSISSALSQDLKCVVYVSDNSTNSDVELMVSRNFPTIKYFKTGGNLDVFQHFEYAKNLIRTKYFSIIHDDDFLFKNYATIILENFELNEKIVAISTNSLIIDIDGNQISNRTSFKIFSRKKTFENMGKFIQYYLNPGFGGVAPWSLYAYRTINVKNNSNNLINNNDNLFTLNQDLIYLSCLLKYGNIMWINQNLGCIREHQNSLTQNVNIKDYKKIVFWMKYNKILISKNEINIFRLINIMGIMKRKKIPERIIIQKNFIKIIRLASVSPIFFKYLLLTFIKKIRYSKLIF